jgi:carbonic anhydrase
MAMRKESSGSRSRFVTLVALTFLVGGCSPSETETASEEHDAVHWGYEAANGPAHWGSMDPEWALCAEGREQSPIDLANASLGELSSLELRRVSAMEVDRLNQDGVISLVDNGHSIQINAKTGETLTIGGKSYALLQFHFHAPSEHTRDGQYFPMEIHFVHQAEDGALAVVGVFVEEGAENPGIAPLWGHLPDASETETTVQIPAGFADHIFSGDPTGAYHYRGSLTTPPCSEGVTWIFRATPTQFSTGQIVAFTAIYDHNNRPVQALNARPLYLDESPTVTIR